MWQNWRALRISFKHVHASIFCLVIAYGDLVQLQFGAACERKKTLTGHFSLRGEERIQKAFELLYVPGSDDISKFK